MPKHLQIIPNGTNIELITKNKNSILKELKIDKNKFIIVFMGKLDYLPNQQALERIFDFSDRLDTDCQILVIGENKNYLNTNKITFTGSVENVFNYINVANLCIAPIEIGSGTRLKIIEYMISNKLVLSTKKGCEGLNIKNNFHLIIEDINNFTQMIMKIKNNFSNYNHISKNGQDFIKLNYLWDNIIKEK